MTSGGTRVRLRRMAIPDDTLADLQSAGRPRTLTLEIDPGTGPMRGRLFEGGAPQCEFSGWLGLAKALEQALGAPLADAAPDPEETP
jgi:hypothetical protein